MKFQCSSCAAIFYADRSLRRCEFCEGNLGQGTPRREQVQCANWEAPVELVHSIPRCEWFVLNNAPGNRCTRFALPRRCLGSRLPEYQPRTGIIATARR